jgi:hypothetical protein
MTAAWSLYSKKTGFGGHINELSNCIKSRELLD